jgi:hypothetical protein
MCGRRDIAGRAFAGMTRAAFTRDAALIQGRARDSSQHQRNGIAAGGDRQPSQRYASDISMCCGRIRQPLRRRNIKIYHP